jgi:drug/metabolite transporter (DMT)-like permease
VLVLDLTNDVRMDMVGVLWGLAAAFGLASYFVLSEHLAGYLPPLVVASTGMTTGALTLLAFGAVGALPMHATFGTVEMAGHRVPWLVPVIGMSVVATVISYVAGIVAARALGASLASFIGLTEVVFAVLVAWLLLGQLPSTMQFAGGALIVLGVVLVHADEVGGDVSIEPASGALPERGRLDPE